MWCVIGSSALLRLGEQFPWCLNPDFQDDDWHPLTSQLLLPGECINDCRSHFREEADRIPGFGLWAEHA